MSICLVCILRFIAHLPNVIIWLHLVLTENHLSTSTLVLGSENRTKLLFSGIFFEMGSSAPASASKRCTQPWNYYLQIPVGFAVKLLKYFFLLKMHSWWCLNHHRITHADFRDGVSESQFTQVINIELEQIIEVGYLFYFNMWLFQIICTSNHLLLINAGMQVPRREVGA